MYPHGHENMRGPTFKSRRNFLSETRGSISILTLGLFSILLVTSLILIDISSIYISKRSLTLATEAAAQQGVKNLDAEAYYRGEFNVNRLDISVYGFGQSDPGIPIDCDNGVLDARRVLNGWQAREGSDSSGNLRSIVLLSFNCDGYEMAIQSQASAQLPIPIPFIDIQEVRLISQASAIAERATTNNFSGIDIG